MLHRHDTPANVARVLQRFCPKGAATIFDPCVGGGALIAPFISSARDFKISCLDLDPTVKPALERQFGKSSHLKIKTVDFLKWSESNRNKKYDCVVMNPPFSGKKINLIRVERSIKGITDSRSVPIEIAFITRAVKFLRPGGRLLAIVPASVTMSQGGAWLRGALMETGAIRVVHELPSGTFKGVEGRMYLFVYEHGVAQTAISVRNHRLRSPDKLTIPADVALSRSRLDFAFHEAFEWRQTLRDKTSGWTVLTDVATIWRGTASSPVDKSKVLHSTNMERGLKNPGSFESEFGVRKGDIIAKRVARNCADSLRLFQAAQVVPASDCILVIRANATEQRFRLLFALRVLLACREGAALVERGLGATYIALSDLEALEIPMSLSFTFPRQFENFRKAVRCGRWQEVIRIESRVRKAIRNRKTAK